MADNLSLFPKRRGRAPRRAPGEGTGHVQSLTRGLTLLERLSEERYGISLTDLAQRVGLAPSTTHRLLKSLEKMKFVYQDEERGLWYVGVKAFSVGTAFLRDRDFVSVARRFMRRLMEESGESVNLAVLDAGEVVFLSQVECRQMMRALAPPGGRVGAHCSGVGKALLSVLPDAEIAAILHRRGRASPAIPSIPRPASSRTWRLPASAAMPSTTRSRRSDFAASPPPSTTNMVSRWLPSPYPVRRRGSPTTASPRWGCWSSGLRGRSRRRWADGRQSRARGTARHPGRAERRGPISRACLLSAARGVVVVKHPA